MDLRSELLKSIWYGFTALDLEKSGKVSKSQLKVSGGSSTWTLNFFFTSENSLTLLLCRCISFLNSYSITWARSGEDVVKIFEMLSKLNVTNVFVI